METKIKSFFWKKECFLKLVFLSKPVHIAALDDFIDKFDIKQKMVPLGTIENSNSKGKNGKQTFSVLILLNSNLCSN